MFQVQKNTIMKRILQLSLLALFTFYFSFSFAQRDFSKVEIKAEKLTDNMYVLFGQGGNIGLLVGDEEAVLIDDQFAPLSALT